jgi:hypothetical protein
VLKKAKAGAVAVCERFVPGRGAVPEMAFYFWEFSSGFKANALS